MLLVTASILTLAAGQGVPAAADPVLAAAGDIACAPGEARTATTCRHAATARLLGSATAVLPLGDTQYGRGALRQYRGSYHPTWGVYKAKTRPVPGNHEYHTPGATGYFTYFGARAGPFGRGWYSWNLGNWHIIALNSNCEDVGGCGPTSRQGRWLAADLRANTRRCILAYWHHARFSSGRHGNDPDVAPFWQLLSRDRADVVLSAHDHLYERFALRTPTGARSASGIRQFTVGTGGKSLYEFRRIQPASQARSNSTFGVLRLTLHPRSYSWSFVPIAGQTFRDAGRTACH
jgi:hypothetical protein